MRRCIHIMALTAAILSAVSCNKNELKEEFINTTEGPGLVIKSNTIFEYSPADCQIGYRPAGNEFRMSDDRMGEYVVLKLEKIPSNGEETTGTLTYTTPTNIITKSELHLKLVKEKDNAMGRTLWFWNKKNGIGIVVSTINN